MKKRIVYIIAAVLFMAGIVLTSCGASEKCPAYGQVDTQQESINS